jgi:hypothetical protein
VRSSDGPGWAPRGFNCACGRWVPSFAPDCWECGEEFPAPKERCALAAEIRLELGGFVARAAEIADTVEWHRSNAAATRIERERFMSGMERRLRQDKRRSRVIALMRRHHKAGLPSIQVSNVRALLRFLRRRTPSWARVAMAVGTSLANMNRIRSGGSTTRALASRVATAVGLTLEAVIGGAFAIGEDAVRPRPQRLSA